MTAATDYAMDYSKGYRSGEDPAILVGKRLAAAEPKTWRNYARPRWLNIRSSLAGFSFRLGTSTAAQRELPTDKRRLKAIEVCDPELESLLFQYGRYLLIGCSRPGGLPANLQGCGTT